MQQCLYVNEKLKGMATNGAKGKFDLFHFDLFMDQTPDDLLSSLLSLVPIPSCPFSCFLLMCPFSCPLSCPLPSLLFSHHFHFLSLIPMCPFLYLLPCPFIPFLLSSFVRSSLLFSFSLPFLFFLVLSHPVLPAQSFLVPSSVLSFFLFSHFLVISPAFFPLLSLVLFSTLWPLFCPPFCPLSCPVTCPSFCPLLSCPLSVPSREAWPFKLSVPEE